MYIPARSLFVALFVLLPLSLLLALALGAVPISPADVIDALLGADSQVTSQLIVNQIRLPRALLAACVGALLGISGATAQGLFRNPLADPSLIGVTAGAMAGGSLAIVLGGSALSGYWGLSLVSVGAFTGGVVAVLFVYRLATGPMGTSVATMLLAGIAITALAGSLNSFLEFIADSEMLRRISLWKMGGLEGADSLRVAIAFVVTATVILILPRYATALNALLLGESEARHLGIDVDRVKYRLIGLVALAVGVSVALAGSIAFVGLVVPHILRLLAGPNHRHLLPASALAGAILLLLADTFARVVIAPTELPVGMVTALLGAPFFIVLLRRKISPEVA